MRASLSALVIVLVGCKDGVDTDSLPSIAIVQPSQDSVVCGTPLHIELDIENFTLVAPGGEAVPGEGHVDVDLNGIPTAMDGSEVFDVPTVEAGSWRLQVALVNNDHTALEPVDGTIAQAFFDVDPGACSE